MRHLPPQLTRLALVLLALLGFAAPVRARHVDPVAQTCASGPSKEDEQHLASSADHHRDAVVRAPFPARLVWPSPPEGEPRRRYLLHRAWLL